MKDGGKQEGKKGEDFTVIQSFFGLTSVSLLDELLFWIILWKLKFQNGILV